MSGKNGKKEKGLNDYGIIYLSGPIEVETSESACKEIIEYNISGKTDHIQVIINSSGGSCSDGFAIIDILEWSRIPIFTTGIGMIASMALLVFMTETRRDEHRDNPVHYSPGLPGAGNGKKIFQH